MACYIHITVALSLSARTSGVLRDQSRANLNKIASLDEDWAKITLRRVSTVFHNTTYNKINEEKCEKRQVTHLVTSPRWMRHREYKSHDVLWVVARGWSSPSAFGLGAGTLSPWSSGQTDHCPCVTGRGGNDHRSRGPKVFLPCLLLPLLRKGRKGDEALHPVIS